MMDDPDGIPRFVAVAEVKGFRAAGNRLGVSGSAVSFYLYYPQRRHSSPAFRALIDYLLPARRATPNRAIPP